jgi:integrase
MSARKRRTRVRVGRVSVYPHHGTWWIYYRDGGQQVRRKVAPNREEAENVAAQVNAQLAAGTPTQIAFTPITVIDLRQAFLDYHERVINSAVATVRRYRAATQHLANFALRQNRPMQAHELRPDGFVAYLRILEVAPNGHPHTTRRKLRHKGIQFILMACRSMFAFAGERHCLPPYASNPFKTLRLDRFKVEDAKPIFVFDAETELSFFKASDRWAFPIHFMMAKTGIRTGELVHLLIDDLDLNRGWLRIRNKSSMGWRVKTGTERSIPLLPEVVQILRQVIGVRRAGPVFLRQRFANGAASLLAGDLRDLEQECQERQRKIGQTISRAQLLQIARTVWRDAGAVKADAVRTTFIRIMRAIGHPEATCPKSWRHTFATIMQDANVDPLIRQLTLGHKPTTDAGLGMTGHYTHTRPETQKQQIEAALRRWPETLELAHAFEKGDSK